MKVGDLVKRKPKWGDWVKCNPWMLTEKDFQIGILVLTNHELCIAHVLWEDCVELHKMEDIEVIDADR